jgi:hypothetical protein
MAYKRKTILPKPTIVGHRNGDGSTSVVQAFPHGIACEGCFDAKRCNYCGAGNVTASNGRCTNGRCSACCAEMCQHRMG